MGRRLVNRLWTFSSARISEIHCGDQTTLLYSRSGLINVTIIITTTNQNVRLSPDIATNVDWQRINSEALQPGHRLTRGVNGHVNVHAQSRN